MEMKYLMRFSNYVVMVSMLSMSFWMPAAQASMISSEQVIASQAAQQDRDRLRALLERADVRKQLMAHGVDASAAQARVSALTDSEVASISGQIGSVPAGGDDNDTDFVTMIWKIALILIIVLLLANPAGAVI